MPGGTEDTGIQIRGRDPTETHQEEASILVWTYKVTWCIQESDVGIERAFQEEGHFAKAQRCENKPRLGMAGILEQGQEGLAGGGWTMLGARGRQ